MVSTQFTEESPSPREAGCPFPAPRRAGAQCRLSTYLLSEGMNEHPTSADDRSTEDPFEGGRRCCWESLLPREGRRVQGAQPAAWGRPLPTTLVLRGQNPSQSCAWSPHPPGPQPLSLSLDPVLTHRPPPRPSPCQERSPWAGDSWHSGCVSLVNESTGKEPERRPAWRRRGHDRQKEISSFWHSAASAVT